MRKTLELAVIAIALVGCESIAPNVSQESCLNKVYILEEGLNASYNLSADLLQGDIIDAETAEDVANKLDATDVVLNRAAPLCKVDERTALNLLLEVKASLDEVDHILSEAE